MDHAGVDALLGAYVLDACDVREQVAVRAHLDDCEPCGRTLATLYEAAGWLGVDASDTPPPALRTKILDAAEKSSDPRGPSAANSWHDRTSRSRS